MTTGKMIYTYNTITKLLMIARPAALGTLCLLLSASLPLSAQNRCSLLKVVGGEANQTVVSKKVSPPGAFIPVPFVTPKIRNNWNTDFEVPSNVSFTKYIAKIESISTKKATFSTSMFLKYSNDTADETYKGDIQLTPGQSTELRANPRRGEQPYQVNLLIGGFNAVGHSYKLSVRGCR